MKKFYYVFLIISALFTSSYSYSNGFITVDNECPGYLDVGLYGESTTNSEKESIYITSITLKPGEKNAVLLEHLGHDRIDPEWVFTLRVRNAWDLLWGKNFCRVDILEDITPRHFVFRGGWLLDCKPVCE